MLSADTKEPQTHKAKPLAEARHPTGYEPAHPNSLWQQLAVRRAPIGVQTQLHVSAPGNAYEREADRVADEVLRVPEARLQRQADEEDKEKEEFLQTKPLVQRRATDGEGANEAPPIVHEVLRSPGQPLDSSTRAFFEPRFGYDFSQVRVHTDARAAESVRAVNALAYAVGHDIVLAPRQYARETAAGRHLLAHELAHVVQQAGQHIPTRPRVSSLVRSPIVRRYGTGEHAQMGGNRSVKISGVTVTEGELITMGDFFESPDQIFKASTQEISGLVTLIRRDKAAKEGKAGATPVSTEEWQKATGGRYLELAKRNDPHFAPKSGTKGTAGKDHRGEWRVRHTIALDPAHVHAATDQKVPPGALARNAFAAHFLTDAFAAGHLLPKAGIMDVAKSQFGALKTTGWIFKENAFTKTVARRVLADPDVKAKIAGKQLKLLRWGDFSPQRFSELLWQIQKKEPEAFYSAFAKIVHDQSNDAIRSGKGAGIDVNNHRGDGPWQLSGDDTLDLSPKTLKIAKAAVDESYRNLEKAATTKGPLHYESLYKNVWSYTPMPTPTGVKQIQKIVNMFADPANTAAVDAFVKLSIGNIDVAISELEKIGRIR
jgi:hypothetical protein